MTKTDRKRSAGLDRRAILREALSLVDEQGLAALTMRGLGSRLGVEAMSLYYHLDGRDDILEGLVELAIAEITLPPAGAAWKDGLRLLLKSERQSLKRHPNVLPLVASRPKTGPAAVRLMETILGMLRNAGFSVERAHSTFHLLQAVVIGFVTQELNEPMHREPSDGSTDRGTVDSQAIADRLSAAGFPFMAELVSTPAAGYDVDYEYAIDVVIDGLDPHA